MRALRCPAWFLCAVLAALTGCGGSGTTDKLLDEAVRDGIVTGRGSGAGEGWLEVELTLPRTDHLIITIPVGLRFTSRIAGLQDVMIARTVMLIFPGGAAPQRQTARVEIYCVQRFREFPSPGAEYQLPAFPLESTDPTRRLAEGLAGSSADRDSRQLAIWLVSEGFLHMPRARVAQRFIDRLGPRLREQAATKLDRQALSFLQSRFPTFGRPKLEALIAEYRTTHLDRVVERAIDRELADTWSKAGPLLAACGHEPGQLPFFR